MSRLHKIGVKHKAEKAFLQCRTADHAHSYLDIYDKLFADFDVEAKLNILEIGTRYGGSVKMWLEYFPNAQVYGLDNLSDRYSTDLTPSGSDRFTFIVGDQNNIDDLKKITELCPEFDLIIDDACHLIDSFIFSYRYLIGHLATSGMYCVEDLYNNYKFWNSRSGRPTAPNKDGETYDTWVAALSKEIHGSCCVEDGRRVSPVFSLHTYPGLLIIRKSL